MTAPLVDFEPTSDPLMRDPVLAHRVDLPVLGIIVRFETNSRYVLGVATESFGAGPTTGAKDDSSSALRVRVIVREGAEPVAGSRGRSEHGHAPVRHVCPDATRLFVHSPGSIAVSDPLRREAIAYVTTALAADRLHFRAAMLEAITFSLLVHFDRHPVHAAAITRDGRAVLLAGPTGSGKSTLSYMAQNSGAGLGVLSDDRVWVQLQPTPCVWGWPAGFRLLPELTSTFPELLQAGATSYRDGKHKLTVEARDESGNAGAPVTNVRVCLLERGAATARLESASPSQIVDALARNVPVGFDRYPERQVAVIAALAARPGWRLRLSADPLEALPLLAQMLDEV